MADKKETADGGWLMENCHKCDPSQGAQGAQGAHDYAIFPEIIFVNSQWSIQTRSSSWATNYLHKVPSEPCL